MLLKVHSECDPNEGRLSSEFVYCTINFDRLLFSKSGQPSAKISLDDGSRFLPNYHIGTQIPSVFQKSLNFGDASTIDLDHYHRLNLSDAKTISKYLF